MATDVERDAEDTEPGHLGKYAREIMRDVAEAKRVGGISIIHIPDDMRIRPAHMRAAARQLFPHRIICTPLGNHMRITW